MTAVEFNYMITDLSDNLQRYAMCLTSNPEDAKDLVQETFVKAITFRDKFEENSNLKAWTFTIMKNTFINNYRTNLKIKITFDHTDDLYYMNLNNESAFEIPDTEYSVKEIQKNIEELRNDLRLPFVMHSEGYKYKEISKKLCLKIGTVKSRIYFARKRLMEKLQDYELS